MIIVPGVEVIVHPVSLDEKPVPETVTSVPATPPMGGEPVVGLSLIAAVGAKLPDAESP
jgi:hypothetical protein